MRVFSRAGVLLTFISQASFKSGSQILTIGTLAEDTHTTFSIPSMHGQYHPVRSGNRQGSYFCREAPQSCRQILVPFQGW
jgi:hypothetical protein